MGALTSGRSHGIGSYCEKSILATTKTAVPSLTCCLFSVQRGFIDTLLLGTSACSHRKRGSLLI